MSDRCRPSQHREEMTAAAARLDVMPRPRVPLGSAPPRAAGSLLGIVEIAELLGVSRQRAHQLAERADFPAPEVQLRMGRIWRRLAVEEWMRRVYRPNGS